MAYVGGFDYADPVAFYSADRPHAFFHFDYSRNLWVKPEALAREGLLAVCLAADAACLQAAAPFSRADTREQHVTLKGREIVMLMTPPL